MPRTLGEFVDALEATTPNPATDPYRRLLILVLRSAGPVTLTPAALDDSAKSGWHVRVTKDLKTGEVTLELH